MGGRDGPPMPPRRSHTPRDTRGRGSTVRSAHGHSAVEEPELRRRLGLDPHAVVAGEARVAEVGRVGARGLEHAVEGEVAEGVGAEVAPDLLGYLSLDGML